MRQTAGREREQSEEGEGGSRSSFGSARRLREENPARQSGRVGTRVVPRFPLAPFHER